VEADMVAWRETLLSLVHLATCTGAVPAQGAAHSDSPRVAGWQGDLDLWLHALGSEHYVLKRGPLPDSLERGGERFRSGVARWSDDRALAELMRLAAMAGDGHTYVLPWGQSRFTSRALPIRLYAFTDGLFVIDAEPGYEPLIGARVRSLAGIPGATLLHRIEPFVARDNAMGVLWAGPVLLRFVGFLEALTDKRFAREVPAEFRIAASRDTSVELALVPAPPSRGVPKLIPSRRTSVPPPLYLRDVAEPYWFEALNDTVLYVQFNQVVNAPTETLAAFSERLRAAIGSRAIRQLIIDVRHNSGGNLGLLDPLIAVLRDFTAGARPGRLQVISGRNTFSAAQVFLARAEHEARAEIVGEPSSSKPNFVGEENTVILPWSGAITSISNRYHETIPGDTRHWIEPHPRIALGSADYFANRDPVLEALLAAH
jgi:hypothetical protein